MWRSNPLCGPRPHTLPSGRPIRVVDLYGKILPADFAIAHRKIRSQRVQVLQTAQVRALAAPVAAPTFVSPAALDESQKRKPGGQLGSKRGPYMTVKRRRAMGLDE